MCIITASSQFLRNLHGTPHRERLSTKKSKRRVEESRMFCIDNLSGDELSISFYTGIVMTRMNLVIQYLGFQLFREPETVSSASDVMSLLTVNDFP